MMENLIIKQEERTPVEPNVDFNATTGNLCISGLSLMVGATLFYEPIFEWVEEFVENTKLKSITFDIKIQYFNTSTSKWLFKILTSLKKFQTEEKGELTINWHYDKNDPDMEEDIEDYIVDTELQINLIAV